MRDQRHLQLFLAFRERGDVRALGELFDALSPELLGVARHVASDTAEAEDLVQATFLTALEHPERYDEARPLTAWLVGVLTKEALSWRRQAARRPDAERVLGVQHEREARERPELQVGAEESSGLLMAALQRLPARYREVLEPHLRAGKSPAEIARERDASPATVRVQLHRGLAQLRQLLPAGMAGGLVLSLSERGLAEVRAELVSHAQGLSLARTAATGVGALTTAKLATVLMSHRIALGALALLLVCSALYLLPAAQPEASTAREELVAGELQQGEERVATPIEAQAPHRSDAQPAASVAQARVLLDQLRVQTTWSDGTPAASIAFRCVNDRAKREVTHGRSDASGFATLAGLAPGSYSIYGDRGGHAFVQLPKIQWDAGATIAPELMEQLTPTVTLKLERGTDVRGRVVDSDGRGVAAAAIWVSTGMTRRTGTEVARSAADGSFELQQLTSGCLFGARAEGFGPTPPQHVQYWKERVEEGATIELDLVLGGAEAQLSGVVLDPAGRPLAGARVRIGAQDYFDSIGPTGAEGPPPPIEVLSDEHGAFSCRRLEPGEVEVACQANGFAVRATSVSIDAGGSARVELQLEPGAWVRGKILAADGTPVESATVSVYQRALNPPAAASSFYEPRAYTDEAGFYEVGPLCSGTVEVSATTTERELRASETLELNPGESYLWNHSLQGLPTITGVALGLNGESLAGWTVVSEAMQSPGPAPVAVRTESDGSFELRLSREGACRLALYAPEPEASAERMWVEQRAPRSWLEDVPTGSTEVRLTLDPAQDPTAVLRGELDAGAAPHKTLVTIYHETFFIVAQAELVAGTTHFEFDELPAGALSIKFESEGREDLWRKSIELTQGQDLDLGRLSL